MFHLNSANCVILQLGLITPSTVGFRKFRGLCFHLNLFLRRDRSCRPAFNAIGKLLYNVAIAIRHMIISVKTSACSSRFCVYNDMKVLNPKKKIPMNFRIMKIRCRLIVLPVLRRDAWACYSRVNLIGNINVYFANVHSLSAIARHRYLRIERLFTLLWRYDNPFTMHFQSISTGKPCSFKPFLLISLDGLVVLMSNQICNFFGPFQIFSKV
jgi:hypothetical protein